MPTAPKPTWEVVNPDAELNDGAISALAALLLDLVKNEETQKTAVETAD